MMRKSFYTALVMVLLAFMSSAQAKLFNGSEFYLENGMRVMLLPNHKAPIVKHMVWYRSGSVDETLGKGGTAHLLEHLMFRGTKKVPAGKFNQILEENGAESNAFTGTDMTAYHQLLDVSRLELAMFLEADRMRNLKINDEDFALERDIVFQERKQRVDTNPTAVFGEVLRQILWLQHPYSRPVSGTETEIKGLTKEDVVDFYKKFYAPDNAVLVLAGDIDLPTAKKLSEKYYGKISASKNRAENKVEFPVVGGDIDMRFEMRRSQVKGVRVSQNYAAPSYNNHREHVYALSVLSAYMGEGETSKLYKKLVREQKAALGVSSSYDGWARSYGVFSVSVIPQNGVAPEEMLSLLDKAWNEALAELDYDTLEKTKDRMLAGLVYLRDNPEDAADIVGMMAVSGMSLQEIEDYENSIRTIQVEDVKKAARFLTDKMPRVEGVLLPEKTEEVR